MAQAFDYNATNTWKVSFGGLVQDLMRNASGEASGMLIASLLCSTAERTRVFKEYIDNHFDSGNPLSTLLYIKLGLVRIPILTSIREKTFLRCANQLSSRTGETTWRSFWPRWRSLAKM